LKQQLAEEKPYGVWLTEHMRHLGDLPYVTSPTQMQGDELRTHELAFGFTVEDEKYILGPMAEKAAEEIGSMGHDAPLAVMSERPQSLYDYFQQLFAQVTNPPLDAIREEMVTSTSIAIGAERNLLEPTPESCALVVLDSPFVTSGELTRLAQSSEGAVRSARLDMVFPVADSTSGLAPALEALFVKANDLVDQGANTLVLSDRATSATMAPIPSLLAVAGLHNYLVREKKRTKVTLLVESGDARETHHCALLLAYGASAVNPYMALDAVADMARRGLINHPPDVARRRFLDAVDKGVIKIMSKMGISTVSSYCGSQTFEAIGLARDVVDRYFTKTPSRISGIGLKNIAADALAMHARGFGIDPLKELPQSGAYQWRRDGERHLFSPETVFALQHGTRAKRYDLFKQYTHEVDSLSRGLTLRGLLDFKTAERAAVPVAEVEPVSAIVKRFATGAMSYGSLSREAHETLAIAMNRLGGRSNSGEGGEDPARYTLDANGDSRRSAVHQVASARFGVTSQYLNECTELQIKMAQGAKPGEGGQLPGGKVYPWIATVRYATPGVGLISPPPHHDIYSIEDLAQLIHDLRCANDKARISVKLVAEVGVGTVAAGVVKAKSDVVLISGHDGGTGASPIGSIKHAGAPWELGLAEVQQTLIANQLRDRVVVQVDGQLKTGRDVVVAALLGADEFGFATAPLVVMGCIYMRVCHLDTCPVGVATQNPELRKRFSGQADHVVNFFEYIAEE
ncbi:MAG: glutamate synthase subunit alpha, partial [Clostridia bacterium]|nr:glutamate synthase subunit alpha [Deltaproteobacteria bacterium]